MQKRWNCASFQKVYEIIYIDLYGEKSQKELIKLIIDIYSEDLNDATLLCLSDEVVMISSKD